MSAIVLPAQSCIRYSPAYSWNGFCSECQDTIYGSSFVCGKGEFCCDCAVALDFLCNNCSQDQSDCTCAEVVRFHVPVNLKECA